MVVDPALFLSEICLQISICSEEMLVCPVFY